MEELAVVDLIYFFLPRNFIISGLNDSDSQKKNGEDELNSITGATLDAKEVSMLLNLSFSVSSSF